MVKQDGKITAEDIRTAIEQTYTVPEWYIGFEVGNSTGYNTRRHADAVVINAYPSKGYETRGFEIKVSKSDLKSELDNGIKSDEIARFCDYWFLVVPKGLADGFVLPPTWGVIEYSDGKLRQKIKAEKLDKQQPTAGFLCAMLRGRERLLCQTAQKISEEERARIKESASWQGQQAIEELSMLQVKLKEIGAATGIYLDKWTPSKEMIQVLKTGKALRTINRNIKSLEVSAKYLLDEAKDIQLAVAEIFSEPTGEDNEKA